MLEFVPVEDRVDLAKEIQIESADVYPIVNGKAPARIVKFECSGDRVRITYSDPNDGWTEKTEEFDAKNVKLSGWPAKV